MIDHVGEVAGALGAAFLAVLSALGWCPAAIADVPASAVSDAAGGMDDAQPCDELAAFTCSTLRVPIDHDGEVAGSFDLAVAVSDNDQAPGGVLLFLAGGPGQAGVATAPRVVERYLDPLVLEHFRLVMFDQRGTGAAAIDCGPLQAAVGGSDYLTPPRRAVEECGEHLDGQRDFLSTADTVGDIELLRRALGAEEMVIDGVSYGTFTAAHYALAYPHRVAALVLDSVVPQDGFDPFARTEMSAAARVLADACADARCSSDPVAELARLVGDGTVAGPALIEMLAVSSLSSVEPSMTGVIDALADAGDGDVDGLRRLLAQATSVGLPAWQLSAGLHLATICTDQRFPWGDSSTPLHQRQPALDEALAGLRLADIAPFDVATAGSLLAIAGCRYWPESRPARFAEHTVIAAPTLIVVGEHDLFTPLEWAQQELEHLANGRLVVVPGGGHGAQASSDPAARDAVTDFLISGGRHPIDG